MDSRNHKLLSFFLICLLGFSISFCRFAEASTPRCQSLFEPDQKIEIVSSGQLLDFLETASTYEGRSTLGVQEYLQNAGWWQTQKLLFKIRKLKGSDVLTIKQIDQIVAQVYKITRLQNSSWSLLKDPVGEADRLAKMPRQLIKDRFDQVLAREGLIKALSLVSRVKPSKIELRDHRNLMRASLFTLLTAVGVTGKWGLHPFGVIDPYMPEIDVLRDKMMVENLVALADEIGYEAALEKLQIQFSNMGQKQRFYHIFKSVYHWSGKVFVAAFIVGHAYSLYEDHEHTLAQRQAVATAVSQIVPPQVLENLKHQINDPHRLGEAIFEKYFELLHAKNPSIDKQSDEMLEVRGEIIQNLTEELKKN